MSDDTDLLLVKLISLLDSPVPDQSVLLEVLADCNGNVEAAALALKVPKPNIISTISSASSKKRKRPVTDLDNWIKDEKKKPIKSEQRSLDLEKLIKMEEDLDNIEKAFPLSFKPIRASTMQFSKTSYTEKPVTNLMSILHTPSADAKSVPRLPPLTLSNPSMVAEHTPCSLHLNIFPPELACQLFYTMIDESKDWARNKWWLFDRLVESPHRTSFYIRRDDNEENGESWHDAAKYWYNGRRSTPPKLFPNRLEEACRYVERVVNEEMRKRDRFPLEWTDINKEGYIWSANVAAANRYEGRQEGVGFHSDQLTYLGPNCTIASISLGTPRVFRLREVISASEKDKRQARTFNISLPHNSLLIMHASTQERYKHSIPQQNAIDAFKPSFPRHPDETIETFNSRINITFRFYRPDFRAEMTPKCKCGIPMILRPDMKNRNDGQDKYWWTCFAAAQKDGQTCNLWQVMDVRAEGRGQFFKGNNAIQSSSKINV